ncbi:methyltransferase [Actinoplanes sp. SE50]|uniref:class I SAM-dependent methyltransferase n=1 Tax=unclassified Actinoplanes TaxID=2626549 RepID=UPI00023ECD8C|nr:MULTISPECIES: class I SAM-dependent methyltransferase [unclassified Actinoplanes]AEV87735.1 Putative S-adenosyl-L-methionine-dependent methyltransferase [Actinoplanes sp. SE50/110]ATO86137.1 methyltransferase [Actinoplanes sp. SE50]SLM03551.1 methyltransferase [Actinoplanes sp. SE50/110]
MAEYRASQTAVLVCQGRAAAHDRIAPGRFADPTAWELLRDDERTQVDLVREQRLPADWNGRVGYEMVLRCAEMMVPRTVAIDEAVREHRTPQVVILGAGLDGRAWRMPELAEVDVFEVDQPASQQDKRDRAGKLPGRAPVFVPVDFGRDRLGDALAAAGHRAAMPTTWVWEGVVPYLTPEEVTTTVRAIASLSPSGSRLITNYQTKSASAAFGRFVVQGMARLTGRANPWAAEPWRSTWRPESMSQLLTRHGFTVVRDNHLLDLAAGMMAATPDTISFRTSRVTVADI